MACARRKARMEFRGHALRPLHRDVGRQMRVDAADPRRLGTRRLGVEVDDLQRRMNARVGAARRDRTDAGTGDGTERALERVLHAAPVGLRLPAGERHAGIFEPDGDAHGMTSKKQAADFAPPPAFDAGIALSRASTTAPAPPIFAGRPLRAALPAGSRALPRRRPSPGRPSRGRAWSPHRAIGRPAPTAWGPRTLLCPDRTKGRACRDRSPPAVARATARSSMPLAPSGGTPEPMLGAASARISGSACTGSSTAAFALLAATAAAAAAVAAEPLSANIGLLGSSWRPRPTAFCQTSPWPCEIE